MQIRNHVSEAHQMHFINEALRFRKNMEEPKISKRPCPDYEAQGIRAYQGILVQTPMFLKQIQLGSRVVPLEPGGATSIKDILYTIKVYMAKGIPFRKNSNKPCADSDPTTWVLRSISGFAS